MTLGREFQRAKIPLLIGYEMLGVEGQKISVTTDLAAGGARFSADSEIRTGLKIKIQIRIPWRIDSLDLTAEVLRCLKIKGSNSFEVAAQFIDLKQEEAEEITKIVHIIQSELHLQELMAQQPS